MVKVIGFHAYRGPTLNKVLDVGNLSVTLARKLGREALNVVFVWDSKPKYAQFPAGTGDCYRLGKPFVEALGEGPVLFDLGALHPPAHEGTVTTEALLKDFSGRLTQACRGVKAVDCADQARRGNRAQGPDPRQHA